MAERQKGVQIHRPIIYGSHARLLTPEEKQGAPPEHTHKWTVFLTSATSPPPAPGEAEDMDVLPGGADDLSYLIKRVTFKLHETYTTPSRICDQPPYRVTETGWGEFTVQIRVQFVSESSEKPMTLSHPIKLHHWGAPIEGQPVTQPVAPSAVSTPVAASQPVTTPASAVPPKEVTPKPADVEMAEVEKEAVKIESESAAEGVTGSQPPDAPYDTTMQPAQTQPAGPSSIATKYPVHAWQYDEIIFSDPPLAFYNLLNEHPPTPFPARNRRPRDQREGSKQEQTKKKKPRGSIASTSRQGTPSTPTVGTPAAQATTVPAPGVAAVGIPGEPGSADVPLEFTLEMEKGEWNKLHDAKKKVIDEMDTWRSKLIDQEQQLAKLKNELV